MNDWCSGFKNRKYPTLHNFIYTIPPWNHSKCKQQSKEHQTAFPYTLKCVGLCTIYKCVDKKEYFQHIAHASMWLLVKAKLNSSPAPAHPHYWKSLLMTELQWGEQCWKIIWLENPRPVLSLQLVIQLSTLLINTTLWNMTLKTEQGLAAVCPPPLAVFQKQGCHRPCTGACTAKPVLFRQTREIKRKNTPEWQQVHKRDEWLVS